MITKEPIYTLVADKPDGGNVVQCNLCEHEFYIPHDGETERVCPNCKEHIQYPEYASW